MNNQARFQNQIFDKQEGTVRVFLSINSAKRANRATKFPVLATERDRTAFTKGFTFASVKVDDARVLLKAG